MFFSFIEGPQVPQSSLAVKQPKTILQQLRRRGQVIATSFSKKNKNKK